MAHFKFFGVATVQDMKHYIIPFITIRIPYIVVMHIDQNNITIRTAIMQDQLAKDCRRNNRTY